MCKAGITLPQSKQAGPEVPELWVHGPEVGLISLICLVNVPQGSNLRLLVGEGEHCWPIREERGGEPMEERQGERLSTLGSRNEWGFGGCAFICMGPGP